MPDICGIQLLKNNVMRGLKIIFAAEAKTTRSLLKDGEERKKRLSSLGEL
jgi:hypothetical protein